MNREECLDWLYRLKSEIFVYMPEKWLVSMGDALEIAIEALEHPERNVVKVVPCGDAISRRAVIDILDDAVKDYINENDFDKVQGIAWVKVQRLPSVTTRQKVGRWEDCSTGWMCSNCGATKLNNTNYCPNCGARMEVKE